MSRVVHDAFCDVTNIKNGTTVTADVTDFEPEQYVAVSIKGAVQVRMQWQANVGKYIGKAVGMEFETDGPKFHNVRFNR
jgi:hypothetical protein